MAQPCSAVRFSRATLRLRSDGLAPQLLDDALLLRHFVADDGHLTAFNYQVHPGTTMVPLWYPYVITVMNTGSVAK